MTKIGKDLVDRVEYLSGNACGDGLLIALKNEIKGREMDAFIEFFQHLQYLRGPKGPL
jgi:hypothetical protein